MSGDNYRREEESRAKTVVDEITVEKTIGEIINKYGDKYPLLEGAVDSLRWLLARRHKDKKPISTIRQDQEYKGKECFRAKVEMEFPKGYINVLFAEDENEVILIDIAFIVNDPDDSSITRLLFKNKN